jgi:plastocyanin
MQARSSLASLILLAACGGSAPDAPPDAALDAGIDAVATTVLTVTCPATPAATVTATDGNDLTFMPKSTMISVGQIVLFDMPGSHNIVPLTDTTTDPGLVVNFNQDKCLMFNVAGTFGFKCGSHGFVGAVIVQ